MPQPFYPQTPNRYSYVLNNPLLHVDPSGHAMRFFYTEDVFVISEAEGPIKDFTANVAGPGMTVTLNAHLIVSPVAIENKLIYPYLLSHEMGHVGQARGLGLAFLPAYLRFLFQGMTAMQELGYDPQTSREMAYTFHPMEIQANLAVGLPAFYHAGQQVDANSNVRQWDLQGISSDDLWKWRDLLSDYWKRIFPDRDQSVPTMDRQLVAPAAPAAPVPDGGTIPAEFAPRGVGVVGMTPTNPSGSPANGGSWDSPGGENAQADAAARRAAWERAGSPDYNELRRQGVPGY